MIPERVKPRTSGQRMSHHILQAMKRACPRLSIICIRFSLSLLYAPEHAVLGAVFETPVGYVNVYLVYIMVAVVITIATRGRLSYEHCQRERLCPLPGGELATQKI